MKEDINDTIKELIAKSLAGETTSEQEQQLRLWLQADSQNQKYFDQVSKVAELVDSRFSISKAQNLDINVDAEWSTFLDKIGHSDHKVRTLHADNSRSNIWLKIAASLLILVAATFGIRYLLSNNDITTYQTANETKTVTLPDGSTVTLNRYSTLSHDEDFSKDSRTLSFSGEAFFDVQHNKALPFIITLKNAKIEVIGTSFNVLAYDSIEEAHVTVKTGIVKLSSAKTGREVKISVGQKGSYSPLTDEVIATANEDVNFMAWNTREIIFEGTDLKTIVNTLNKVYGANIVVATDVPETCVITASFKNQDLEAVLRVLEHTLNLNYDIQNNAIVISSAGC